MTARPTKEADATPGIRTAVLPSPNWSRAMPPGPDVRVGNANSVRKPMTRRLAQFVSRSVRRHTHLHHSATSHRDYGDRKPGVILSMHGEIEIATEALRAGASAYVLKHSAADTLSHAIWEALSGRVFVSPRISRSLGAVIDFAHQKDAHAIQLTQREREVLQLVAEGRTIRGISSILKIASRTVVFHKSNIMDKLGRRTTADLTQYAIQSGVIDIRIPDSERIYEVSA